jgi:hypothetical protein
MGHERHQPAAGDATDEDVCEGVVARFAAEPHEVVDDLRVEAAALDREQREDERADDVRDVDDRHSRASWARACRLRRSNTRTAGYSVFSVKS